MTKIEVVNPRSGIVDYSFEADGPEDVARVAERARAAQRRWFEAGLQHRIDAMNKWADQLEAHRPAIREALAKDTGRTRISDEEIDAIYHMIHGHAEKAVELFGTQAKPGGDEVMDFDQQYVPYGVVGVISPWNFPMVLSFLDALPALFAGNAVIVKPSEVTPRFAEPLRSTVAAVPELEDVISIVLGDGPTGQALIANVDQIVFTGSVPTGKKVAVAAAENFIPCALELGGKDPAVVMEGADLDRAATSILRSAVYNSGQVCYSIERIYVQDGAHDELVRLLVEKAKSLKLSYPDQNSGEIGPFIFPRQAEIVADQLADAVAKGAMILTGGEVEKHGGGLWMQATVVSDVTHDMKLMTEETFGPIVPVMRFGTTDEGIRLANDTIYGLSGAVFAATVEEATEVARQVNVGGISVNDTELTRAITFSAEKNAFGFSGAGGSRYGPATAYRFVRKKAVIRNRGEVKPLGVLSEEDA